MGRKNPRKFEELFRVATLCCQLEMSGVRRRLGGNFGIGKTSGGGLGRAAWAGGIIPRYRSAAWHTVFLKRGTENAGWARKTKGNQAFQGIVEVIDGRVNGLFRRLSGAVFMLATHAPNL